MGTRPEASPASLTCNLKSEAKNIRAMLKWTGAAWLVLNLGSAAATTCPCVTEKWVYQGKTYSYCNNPNGAKTSWCPTALNDDGTYTSNLPFVFCEGDLYNPCEDAKDAQEKPPCPCAPDKGGEWKYGGQSQLYCADPSSSGFLWCATETTNAGEYKEGKYAKCTEEIQESCEALEDAEPESICPCVAGGQWAFDGEPQSYCQKPNGIGRANWCPREASVVTTASMSGTKKAYCEGKVLKACQRLEGTRLPTQCPCVDGGQFTYKNKQYSYCEKTRWCATEVGPDGEFIGKFAKCKKTGVRRACHALHELTTPSGKDDLYSTYTKAATGCPCWFDMSRSDCACCEDAGVQCGAPLHNYCTKKTAGRRVGCPGVPANHWTLSTTGYPCFFNTSRTDCAWSASGGAQCSNSGDKGPDSAGGSRCWDPDDPGYCDSVPGDCLHIHKCDSEAECKFNVKFGKFREHHTCQCKTGWKGNGQQCYDSNGMPSSESLSSGDVSLFMAVSNNYYVYPHNSSEFPTGPGEVDLVNNITALFNAGASCAGKPDCNGTFVNLVESP